MSFLREVFSDGGSASASRLLMAYHALIGTAWVSFIVWKNHALPDAVTLAGITAFVVAPYGINAFKGAVMAFSPNGGKGAPSPTN